MKRAFVAALCVVAAVAAGVYVTDVICRSQAGEKLAQAQLTTAELQIAAEREEAAKTQADLCREREEHQEELSTLYKALTDLRAQANKPPLVIEVEVQRTARVLELPEDGDKWCTTLFLDPHYDTLTDPKLRAAQVNALKMFNTEPWCLELRQQTHWNVMKIDDPRAVPFYPIIQKTPCLLVQRACGEVIYKESGGQLAKGPEGLRRALKRATRRHCPDGRCPVAWPTPKPQEAPKPEPIPTVIEKPVPPPAPPVPPAPPEAKKEPDLLPAYIVSAAGCLIGMALRFRLAVQS